ncbi:DUF6529 family protein [Streptomyces sp. NPDC004134]|uniref:DUF6529 family protein n=1 Tax=Streptomyces sp. NPDC004134 TaxID=3364691 RepID=UPI00368D9B95
MPPKTGRPRSHRRPSPAHRVFIALGAVLPVAAGVAIWLIGQHHTPEYTTSLFGQEGEGAVTLKARLGTALLGLAVIQVLLAMGMYGRRGGLNAAPRRIRVSHRLIGWAAFLLSVPIAYHCVRTYGVETINTRVYVHSVAGCALYGAFVAKVLVVHSRHLPGWLLPATGSTLFAAIGVLWYSAPLWALNEYTVPGL